MTSLKTLEPTWINASEASPGDYLFNDEIFIRWKDRWTCHDHDPFTTIDDDSRVFGPIPPDPEGE